MTEAPFNTKAQEDKIFICPLKSCSKFFKEKGNLKIHMRVHTGEKPYECGYPGCTKIFSTLGNCKYHRGTHLNEKPYKCPVEDCSNEYLNKLRLKVHLRTHSGEKPFQCGICGNHFNENGNLKIHSRIHTGAKPFDCSQPLCKKSFKTRGHLADHMKIHKKKLLTCKLCKASFRHSRPFNSHMLIHNGEVDFAIEDQSCREVLCKTSSRNGSANISNVLKESEDMNLASNDFKGLKDDQSNVSELQNDNLDSDNYQDDQLNGFSSVNIINLNKDLTLTESSVCEESEEVVDGKDVEILIKYDSANESSQEIAKEEKFNSEGKIKFNKKYCQFNKKIIRNISNKEGKELYPLCENKK